MAKPAKKPFKDHRPKPLRGRPEGLPEKHDTPRNMERALSSQLSRPSTFGLSNDFTGTWH